RGGRSHLSGQGLAGSARAVRPHVPRSRPVAENPRRTRPRTRPAVRPVEKIGAHVKDALGAVQSVLVLGGGSEIGIAIAKKLAGPRHATVVLAGRDPAALAGPAQQVRDAGASAVETVGFNALVFDSHERVIGD